MNVWEEEGCTHRGGIRSAAVQCHVPRQATLIQPPFTQNPPTTAAGPDDAALPIGYPQWVEILRALHRCFLPSSTTNSTPLPVPPMVGGTAPGLAGVGGRAPGQPSPIETLGLGGMIGESISTIKIPSRRDTEEVGEGSGRTTATGGRIRWVLVGLRFGGVAWMAPATHALAHAHHTNP